ncbi:MAG: transposase [Leptospirales bacterium]|nr:transposase [Leptospirales bacterium]
MLKIILYAYSRGLYSSRAIEEACRTKVTFMALTGRIACQLRKRCLGADTARRRNLYVIDNRVEATHASRMKAKIDALRGRQLYSKRMGIVEPVFANITFQKGLNRFTLRGRKKATPNGCSIAWSTTSKRSPTLLISGVCDRAIRAPGPPFAHRPAKNVELPDSDQKSSLRSVRRGRRGQAASNSVLIRQSG